jgi:hypothetical protein
MGEGSDPLFSFIYRGDMMLLRRYKDKENQVIKDESNVDNSSEKKSKRKGKKAGDSDGTGDGKGNSSDKDI